MALKIRRVCNRTTNSLPTYHKFRLTPNQICLEKFCFNDGNDAIAHILMMEMMIMVIVILSKGGLRIIQRIFQVNQHDKSR